MLDKSDIEKVDYWIRCVHRGAKCDAWNRIKKALGEAQNTSTNSAMDAIVASDEYEKNNSSAILNALQLAFMAGVEWQQQHQ